MANYDFTLKDERKFPNGASVSLYAVSNWPTPEAQRNPSGSPVGSRTGSAQTVTSGSATFAATPEGDYWAYASVNSVDVYERVSVTRPLSGPYIPTGALSTDGTFASSTDATVSSSLATKTYADTKITPASVYGIYKQIQRHNLRLLAATVTANADYVATGSGNVVLGSSSAQILPIYLDPANGQLGVTGYTCKLRVIASCAINDTAPTKTFVVGLYPLTAPVGTSGNLNVTVGTVVTGSTVTFTTPAANSQSAETVTADFTCPSAGWFTVGVNASGAMAAASVALIPFHLEYRNV